MYKWNKTQLKNYINYLNSIEDKNLETINDAIEILKNLKNKKILKEYNNIQYDNEEYSTLKKYNNLINKLLLKYSNINLNNIPYNKLILDKEDVLLTIRDIFYKINKELGKTVERFIIDKDIIDYSKSNPNCIFYIEYLNKFFISLNKSNNITEFTSSAHEFFHIYSTIINSSFFNSIEYEFFGILGELIISNELNNNVFIRIEGYKADINNYISTLNYIKSILLRKYVIEEDINDKDKIKFIVNNFNCSKNDLKEMYKTSLTYSYSTVISYFIALELFDIYLQDKEKCFNICDNIIKSNDNLESKLKENNINLLEHSENYVKKLVMLYKEIKDN